MRATSRAAIFAVVAGGLFLRLRNAWTELETLSRTTLPDDAFYDFAIARHLSLGHPPSIDGVHPTNGYHPLWVALLVPIYRLLGPDDLRLPVHVALTLGALLDAAAMLFLGRIARRLGLRIGAAIAVAIVAFGPYAVVNATCGLETPLALLLLLIVFDRALRAPPRPDLGWFAIFGLVGGLAVLARTDAVVPLAIVTLHLARRAESPLRASAVAAGVAALAVSPWVVYSIRTTGTAVQSSALALKLVADRMPAVWGIAEPSLLLRCERAIASTLEGVHRTVQFLGLGWTVATCAVGALLGIAALSRGPGRARLVVGLRRFAPVLVSMMVLFVAHVAVRKVYRPWYTAPFVAVLAVATGVVVESFARATRRRALVVASIGAVLAVALAVQWSAWQRDGLYAGGNYRAMRASPMPPQGHTDCGAVAYFHQHSIVNLDGVVNGAALEALRAGRLLEYVERERFERVYATDHYHSHVFFGPRYRERLRAHEADVRAVRLATVFEKDALIAISPEPISLGGARGRELLSDGWLWLTMPPKSGFASTLGGRSELVLVLPQSRGAIEIQLRAVVLDREGVQRVDVLVDDAKATTLVVGPETRWYEVPFEVAAPGRHRLTLLPHAPRALRRPGAEGFWDFWRSLRGNAVRALEADGIRLRTRAALPPEGPALGSPGGDAALVAGFQAVERNAHGEAAVWAKGPRAIVRFAASASNGPRTLTLVAGPPPPEGGNAGQTVSVTLDGKKLGEVQLRPGVVEAHSLEVEGPLAEGDHELVLDFARTSGENGLAAYFRAIELF